MGANLDDREALCVSDPVANKSGGGGSVNMLALVALAAVLIIMIINHYK